MRMKSLYLFLGFPAVPFVVQAQTAEPDSVNTQQLKEVVVEGDLQTTNAKMSTYIPTGREKNASQSGVDLIEHIGIPQLRVTPEGNVSTNSGKPVAIFIDFIPATDSDLKAMRLADVKRVEYYEYPSDPRLQGNQFVVNYIMAKYEYGGYVKLFDNTTFITPAEQLLGNVRFQYKDMTYDVMGYGWGANNNHIGSDLTETYRLPQEDGTMKVFDRFSNTTRSKERRRQYFAAFKATYNTDKIQASTQINGSINRTPHSDYSGEVFYTPADFPSSEYSATSNSISKFLSYNGYYFFALPKGNSLTFMPSYRFSHTDENSSYLENSFAPILNGAIDNTNELSGDLRYNHEFGKFGSLMGFVRGSYEYNRTYYTGSATSYDRAKTSRVGVGASYNVSIGNFYGLAGFGWDWDRLKFGDITDKPSAPWVDLSLQYGFLNKHSLSGTFHYSTWAPSTSFKSENVIKATPLMSYTGNPKIFPMKCYDIDFRYTWMPSNNYSLSAYAYGFIVDDRYVYDYEASATGVLRTIRQPLGGYVQGKYGISGNARFLDRSLVFTGSVGQAFNHNGRPYSVNHTDIDWYARVMYYLRNWNFSFTYISDSASPDGIMNGIWHRDKSTWYLQVGWYNSKWNIRATVRNFTRWNWRSYRQEMQSLYYDTFQQFYNGNSHALVQISATYTFGFGKKVKSDNELRVSGSASSGILR